LEQQSAERIPELNDEDVRYLGSLETEVTDGDTVSILPAVAGG
jgi:molybdopterin converting factor small subunit